MSRVWTKADIVNHLAAVHGYRRYLELCTADTGFLYATVDRPVLECRRLLYRCPETYDDGMAVDFRSVDLDISGCLQQLHGQGLRFDIVFVDPWHDYETTWRDLATAFDLVIEGGTIVVHDCLPPREEVATPRVTWGEWCGLTYKAYLDFVTTRDDLIYYTVDTDYGCGVIRKGRAGPAIDPETATLFRRWRAIGDDFAAAFRFFRDHRGALLKLKSVEEFLSVERLPGAGIS